MLDALIKTFEEITSRMAKVLVKIRSLRSCQKLKKSYEIWKFS